MANSTAKPTAKPTATNDITADLADFDAKLVSGEMSVHQYEIATRLMRESGSVVAPVVEDDSTE